MTQRAGGPAFPGAGPEFPQAPGMTFRDYAAVHAHTPWDPLHKMFVDTQGHEPNVGEMAEVIASFRYAMADAMLLERAK